MRICDICKSNPVSLIRPCFEGTIGEIEFILTMRGWWHGKPVNIMNEADICPDCAAKAVLSVMGVESQEVKKP